MVYTCFDKKSYSANVSVKSKTLLNQHIAEQLHKPIIRKTETRKLYSSFKDNIWGTDLGDMQLICKFNKRLQFLLCVIDIYIKYAWVVPLKDKKGITITNAFPKNINESNRKQKKYGQLKTANFTIDH